MSVVRNLLFSALAALTLATALYSGEAKAAVSEPSGKFGVGLILGEPTGVTVKYDMNNVSAIDGGLSFRFDRYIMAYGDYHFKFDGAFGRDVNFFNQLTPYIGVGAVILVSNDSDYHYFDDKWRDDDFALGIRVPVGIEWRTPRVPLGVFAEIVPGIAIVPGTDGFVQGGIGVRYFFR